MTRPHVSPLRKAVASRNARKRWAFYGWLGRLKFSRHAVSVPRYVQGMEIVLDPELEMLSAKIHADITNLIELAERKAERGQAILNIEELPED